MGVHCILLEQSFSKSFSSWRFVLAWAEHESCKVAVLQGLLAKESLGSAGIFSPSLICKYEVLGPCHGPWVSRMSFVSLCSQGLLLVTYSIWVGSGVLICDLMSRILLWHRLAQNKKHLCYYSALPMWRPIDSRQAAAASPTNCWLFLCIIQ